MKTTMKVLATAAIVVASFATLKAQDSLKATAELVSHYVWRGSMATGSPTPNFQPTFAYDHKTFEIGVWGSTDFIGDYKEFDPYISYGMGSWKFTVTDYNWNFANNASFKSKYFDYTNSTTSHRFEGSVSYTGPSSFPLSVTWNTMVYGYDKKVKSDGTVDTTKQAYSTYIELGYTKGMISYFFGFTPWASYYNNYGYTAFDPSAAKKSFSVVNIGATISRSIKITSDFSLPVRATLAINPSATYMKDDYVHLVFGITF
jgi:hypothetical protein